MRVLRISKDIELLIGSFGAIQSVFMTAYLFFGKKRSISNVLLSLFFLFITIRIIKSLFWVYLDFVPDWFINLGFIAHIASGPTLLLYLLHVTFKKQWNALNALHFLPAILLLLFLFRFNEANFWYKGGYIFLLYHQLIYTLLSLGILVFSYLKRKKNKTLLNYKNWIWLGLLMLGAASIQFAYFSNYILGIIPYLAGPIVYAAFIYIITFFGIINNDIFNPNRNHLKYSNININSKAFSYYREQIVITMHIERSYLNPDFSLQILSKQISLPTYLTSHIINKGFNTNFSDYINSYRINEAKSKLTSSSYQHIKIAEIAYESGFNTLSSFNTAFKKHTGLTPSDFRKNHS